MKVEMLDRYSIHGGRDSDGHNEGSNEPLGEHGDNVYGIVMLRWIASVEG